ncbi:MAG: complex I NDUFA9 subunit family protein [Actinobacteria bacterium]|nr:complex I NDUFA9 subunit family protein [Actinomycetota bacterium]MCL5882852.1 complex I NDUFA9 subunit family protein [Actinomycetota bacterium]
MTGATGFVGKHIAGRLVEDGHQIKCLVRSDSSDEAWFLDGLGAETVVGDITIPESVALAAGGCEAVIHLVGIIFERRGASFQKIHVEGTRNALAAAAKVGARRFVHMSALGTSAGATAGYHRTKWAAEEDVRASGIPYTIFRPSIIYGPGSEFIEMLKGQIRRLPVVPVIGDGNYRLQPISVFDVAACFSASLSSEAAAGKVYEIGGPAALTYNELVGVLSAAMGKQRRLAHVPAAMVRPVAWISEKVQSKPFLTRDQLNMLLVDNVCDITAMRRELGVDPVGFAEGLKRAIEGF